MTTYCGSAIPENSAVREALQVPITAKKRNTRIGGTKRTHAAGRPKSIGTSMPTPMEKRSPMKNGFVKSIRKIPARLPNVPGAMGMRPTPKTVAMARASRGLGRDEEAGASVVGVIGLGRFLQIVLVENRLADDVAFRRPVAEIEQAAA